MILSKFFLFMNGVFVRAHRDQRRLPVQRHIASGTELRRIKTVYRLEGCIR